MLNISNNKLAGRIKPDSYSSLNRVEAKISGKVFRNIAYVLFILFIIILFMPWTQNIRSTGTVITLKPEERPQSLNSIIAGQIKSWYVQEGDYVEAGDTILKISEVKAEYFDDKLLDRTQNQVNLKKQSVVTYGDKIDVYDRQLNVLTKERELKLNQARNKLFQAKNKVQNDSMTYLAAKNNYNIAQNQFNRIDSLFKQGLKSKTDLEKRNSKLQDTKAYQTEARNKWVNSQNQVLNLQIELNNIDVKYQSNINKVKSDKLSTISTKLDTENSLTKLENQYSNYLFRNGLYYITAPQSGFITKTISSGIGETIKEGQKILTLMPKNYHLAVELYVDPIDLPLVKVGEKVRIQFDGWPAIIFSGWPNVSHGTYGGEIYGMDQFISDNGKYRVLVKPDTTDYDWPDALRYGSGTSTLIMLNDVPIWYELWRRINGFPPDFYKGEKKQPLPKIKK